MKEDSWYHHMLPFRFAATEHEQNVRSNLFDSMPLFTDSQHILVKFTDFSWV